MKVRQRFVTLRDWRLWQVLHGGSFRLLSDSANPYNRRLLQAAKRHGWDYPFSMAVGRPRSEDVEKWEKTLKPAWEGRQKHLKRNHNAEQRLISSIFGLLNERK